MRTLIYGVFHPSAFTFDHHHADLASCQDGLATLDYVSNLAIGAGPNLNSGHAYRADLFVCHDHLIELTSAVLLF